MKIISQDSKSALFALLDADMLSLADGVSRQDLVWFYNRLNLVQKYNRTDLADYTRFSALVAMFDSSRLGTSNLASVLSAICVKEIHGYFLKLDIAAIHDHISCGLIRPANGNKASLLATLKDCYLNFDTKEACQILAKHILIEKGTTVKKIADQLFANYTICDYM